jgi:hypothetical protein
MHQVPATEARDDSKAIERYVQVRTGARYRDPPIME